MFETVDDITYDSKDGDPVTRRQLEKQVLTKGAWATVLFKYQEIDRKTDDWGPEKAAIVRYRKRAGSYKRHKEFAITNRNQALRIVEILNGWFPPEE